MCELLGFSCKTPIGIRFSMDEFCTRGGMLGIHKDGWGIAYAADDGFDIFLETTPASESKLIDLIKESSIKSSIIISHIRRATVGKNVLLNNQPFTRMAWGRQWVFAHNGDLPDFYPPSFNSFNVIGDTDSEKIFCYFLDQLLLQFKDGKYSASDMAEALSEIARPLSKEGVLNFLMSDGSYLFAYSHSSLYYMIRSAPFKQVTFRDCLQTVNFSHFNGPDDKALVVATRPLTIDESWHLLDKRRVFAFKSGDLVH